MKKIYIQPQTKLVAAQYDEHVMNGGSVYGQNGGLDDAIGAGNGDPDTDENGDFSGDAKQYSFSEWTPWEEYSF